MPVDFYFPTQRDLPQPKDMDGYVTKLQIRLKEALREAEAQSAQEAQRQKRHYDRKIGSVDLEPGDRVLMRTDVFHGKRKIKNRWGNQILTVQRQVAEGVPAYVLADEQGREKVVHRNRLLLISSKKTGIDIAMEPLVTHARHASITDNDLVGTTSMERSDESNQPHEIMEGELARLNPSENLLGRLARGVKHLTGMWLSTSRSENG